MFSVAVYHYFIASGKSTKNTQIKVSVSQVDVTSVTKTHSRLNRKQHNQHSERGRKCNKPVIKVLFAIAFYNNSRWIGIICYLTRASSREITYNCQSILNYYKNAIANKTIITNIIQFLRQNNRLPYSNQMVQIYILF